MSKVEEVRKLYEEQYRRRSQEYEAYDLPFRQARAAGKPLPRLKPYAGFEIQHERLLQLMVEAVQADFHLSPAQAQYVVDYASDKYHASFGDVMDHVGQLAEFAVCFQAIGKENVR